MRVRQCSVSSSRVGRLARAGLHHGGHLLAPPLVGDPDHEHVEHLRVALERRLDLFGIDLLAARVDALRTAAEQGHRAVELEAGEVAGHRVALAVHLDERGGRLDRVLVVADGHVAAPGHAPDLAELHRLVVVADHDRAGAHRDVDEPAGADRRALLDEAHAVEPGLGRTDRLADEEVGQQVEQLVLHDRREHRGGGGRARRATRCRRTPPAARR